MRASCHDVQGKRGGERVRRAHVFFGRNSSRGPFSYWIFDIAESTISCTACQAMASALVGKLAGVFIAEV
jgi:hypothetical protein